VIAALPPPVLSAPAAYEVSFGRVAGIAPRGTVQIAVRADRRLLAVHHLRGRRFEVWVALPRKDVTVRVTATDAQARHSSASVGPVYGLPPSARPRGALGRLDPRLARRVVPLVRAFPGASAVYVRNLQTGAGAAWNARARFPAGSTLKAAIAVEALRSLHGKPAPGSYPDRLLRRAIVYSDNEAANSLEVLFGGSTSGGSARVNALMRGLGLVDSEMYGGYVPGTYGRRPIPLRVDESPSYGLGKRTSAYDLAQLFALVHLATEGKGRLARRFGAGFTRSDARYLLYLLAHVVDRGKLDRFLYGRATVAHKAGWIRSARHDAGLVYWRGGVFTVAVMTYGAGVGSASDILAGRVARRALDRFSAARRPAASNANPIPPENARAGSTGWRGPDVQGRAIEAYASEASVAPGETIRFHVSVNPEQPYHVHVYRLGWYGGAGGREVACVPANCGQTSDGRAYGTPSDGWQGANWPVTDTLTVPDDWVSGYYVARVELRAGDQDGRSTAVLFVVREKPERRAQILVQVPVNTWQAYNPWGGKSLYDSNSEGGRARRVSFERPLRLDYFQTWEWEIQLVRFLEREGYDVAYQTDVDTHRDPASLLRHRLVIVNGHDEYWTSATRTAFGAARDAGTNLAFVGANIGYWRIFYEDGERTIAIDKAPSDLFRRLSPPQPECELLGVQYEDGQRASGDANRDYRVAAPDDPWLRGTGLSVLPELVGPEWDTRSCQKPGAVTLFHYEGSPANADSVRYTAPSGARVFSAGSLQFGWGLDDWVPPTRGFLYPAIPGLQAFMRNALADLLRPAPPLVFTGNAVGGGVELRVDAGPDPRVVEVVVTRGDGEICRTRAGTCRDSGLPGHRSYDYAAIVVDEWGGRSEAKTTAVRVPNSPPRVSLRRSGRSTFVAHATDRDGDQLRFRWRLDGKLLRSRGGQVRLRMSPGRHIVEVTVTDGHGGRTTKRIVRA
jgi:hypothetical protein